MGFDSILKRYFPAVVCLLLGVAAYFQARGLSQVLSARILPDPPPPAAAPKPIAPPAGAAGRANAADVARILSRNAFDSTTGPLDGDDLTLPAAPILLAQGNPLDDPPCEGARVTLLMTSEDAAW